MQGGFSLILKIIRVLRPYRRQVLCFKILDKVQDKCKVQFFDKIDRINRIFSERIFNFCPPSFSRFTKSILFHHVNPVTNNFALVLDFTQAHDCGSVLDVLSRFKYILPDIRYHFSTLNP